MKTIIQLVLSLIIVAVNPISNLSFRPILNQVNQFSLEPELMFYQENISDDFSRFNQVDAVYDGLATSYLDTLATTRAFFNIYDNEYKLIKQLDIDQLDFPQLEFENVYSIINYSNSIQINNHIITYFHADTGDTNTSDKLIVIDISDLDSPIYYFIYLINSEDSVESNIITINKDESSFRLAYIDNNLYLTSVNELQYYTISIIDYNLLNSPLDSGNIEGEIKVIASSESSLELSLDTMDIDFCYIFASEVYCLDNTINDQLTNISLYDLNLDYSRIFFFNQYYVGKQTIDNTTIVKIFYIDKQINDISEEYELSAQEVASFEVNASEMEFVYMDINNESLVIISKDKKYITNLNSYITEPTTLTRNYTKHVYYNNLGKRVAIREVEDEIRVVSDFYDLTYNLDLNGLTPITYNYYQESLLILAQDEFNNTYNYYSYPIGTNQNPSLEIEISFSMDDLLDEINDGYNDNDINTDDFSYADVSEINIASARFYKDELYLIDNGRFLDSEFFLNVIQVIPNNLIRVYFYPLDPVVYLDYASIRITQLGINDKNIALKAVIESEGFPEEGDLTLLVSAYNSGQSSSSSLSKYNELDDIGSFVNNEVTHLYTLNNYDHYINYRIGDSLYTINIPDQALENLVNRLYGATFIEFSDQFPYNLIRFYLDEHNNLFIEDYINNIYILYNPYLRSNNYISSISINNQSLDIESNSFDLAVSANINTLYIDVQTYFKRVLVTSNTQFSLNPGQNTFNLMLKSLDNTIKSITFNVLKPSLSQLKPPAIVLPGLDPNYVSSSQNSSVSTSFVTNSDSSSSSASTASSSLNASSNSVVTSSFVYSSIDSNQLDNNLEYLENSLILVFLAIFSLVVTMVLVLISRLNKRKIKKKKNIKK
jgi:hypothetical protein